MKWNPVLVLFSDKQCVLRDNFDCVCAQQTIFAPFAQKKKFPFMGDVGEPATYS